MLLAVLMLLAAAPSPAADRASPGVAEAEADVHGVRVKVRASSVLADPKQPNHYSPANLLDTDDGTVWAEGVAGNGEGQWVELEFPANTHVDGLELVPGHGKSAKLYSANARPRVVDIIHVGPSGAEARYEIEIPKDQPFGSWIVQWLPYTTLEPPTWKIRLSVKSVWLGSRSSDLCIARLRPIFVTNTGTSRNGDNILGGGEEIGPSVAGMMLHRKNAESFLAPQGPITFNQFSALPPSGVPSHPPDEVEVRPGATHVQYDWWSCYMAVYDASWTDDLWHFLEVRPEPNTGGWTTSFVAPRKTEGVAPRQWRLHWELTPSGWKVRTLDLVRMTDDDQIEHCN